MTHKPFLSGIRGLRARGGAPHAGPGTGERPLRHAGRARRQGRQDGPGLGEHDPRPQVGRQGPRAGAPAAFARALSVRKEGAEAEGLAELYFFETAVRLHRATEGAPYTGLKPAGSDLGPAVKVSDAALAKGDVDALVSLIADRIAEGLRERFARALETRRKAGSSTRRRPGIRPGVRRVRPLCRAPLRGRSVRTRGASRGGIP